MASLSSINFKIGADLKDFRSSVRNIDRSLSNMSRGFGALGATIGAAFVVDRIATFGKEASELSGKMEGVQNAFQRIADPKLLDDLRKATRGTTNDLELMTAAVKAEQFGIPLDQMAKLLEFASRRAQETGQDVDYLVNSIVTGLGRKSPMILDNLGISTTRLKESFGGAAIEAQSIGDITRVVASIAEEEMAKAGDAFTSTADRAAAFGAAIDNIKIAIGERLNAVLGPAMEMFGGILNSIGDLMKTKLSDKFREEAERVAALGIELEASNTPLERKRAIIEELQKKYPDYIGNIDAENINTKDLRDSMKRLNDELMNRAVIMANQEELDAVAQKRYNEAKKQAQARANLASLVAQAEKHYGYQIDTTNMTLEERARAILRAREAERKNLGAGENVFSMYSRLNTGLKVVTESQTILNRLDEDTNAILKSKQEILAVLGISMEEYEQKVADMNGTNKEAATTTTEVTDALEKQQQVLGILPKSYNDVATAMNNSSKIMRQSVIEPVSMSIEQFKLLQFTIKSVGSALNDAFYAALNNGEGFFKTFGQYLVNMVKKLLAVAAAAFLVAAALTIAFGGTPGGFGTAGGMLGLKDAKGFGDLLKGAFGMMSGIPMLASGGIVTGPTLAMVGEGGGPEAVIPLDRLNSFMGGGNINVTGRIQGQDILLSQERASRIRSRYRGF